MEPARHQSVDHATRYDDFLLGMYVVWRWLSVLISTPATIEGRRRYRRPGLATAACLLLAGETAWSSVQLLRGRRRPGAVVWADTAAAAAIAVAFPHAVDAGGADPWHAWGIEQANYHAEAVPFVLESIQERTAAIVLLALAQALGRVLTPGGADWGEATRMATTTLLRGLSTSLFTDVVRSNVARRDEAHAEAVNAARDAALQQSRARHRRYLQHRSLRVLDAVANAEHPRSAALRREANREAASLRSMLMPADGQNAGLTGVATEAAVHGVDLEIVSGDITGAVPAHAVEAIRAEVVATFGGTGPDEAPARRAVLFVDTVGGALVATLRAAGVRRQVRVPL